MYTGQTEITADPVRPAETVDERIAPLKQIPLFRDLKTAELKRIGKQMRLRSKAPGETLLEQGSPVPAVYIIREGTVDVLVNDDRVAQRGALDSLGEMSCLSGEENASATVVTVTPCQVWEIKREAFLKVIDAIPVLRSQLHTTITSRLQSLSHRFSEILKHIPHGIVKIDLAGVITDEFSSRCTDYLGISDLAGRRLGEILFSENPALAEQWDRTIRSLSSDADSNLLARLSHLPDEVTYRHPDGRDRIFNLFYHFTVDKHGALTGLDIGIDDVTQKSQYRQELSSFQDLMTNMEQLLVMFESETGLILQETISHSRMGQVHFPSWQNLKGRSIMDSILAMQDPEELAHFQRWLKMLGEPFILESMSREELIDLAPRFVFESVAGDVVELTFNLNPNQTGTYTEVLGKLDFVADEGEDPGSQVSTMVLMEEIVAAEEEHPSSLPEALNEMQISLEYAQSQMVTPNALALNYRQVAGLIHSVKGLGQSFGIGTIATAAHELEDALEETIKNGQSPTSSAQLMAAFKSLLSLIVVSKSLCTSDAAKDLGHCRSRGPEIRIPLEQFQQMKRDLNRILAGQGGYDRDNPSAGALKRLNETLTTLEMMRLEKLFPRLKRIVADTAGLLHKQVELAINEKEPVHLDLKAGHTLSTCLIQLVKNAVFHAVESPSDRRFLGKPEKARIDLIVTRDREHAFICVQDDGRGINTKKVLERAEQLQILDPETAARLDVENRREDILALLFEPGFSTAGSVSLISGRGVGMSLIKTEIEALGGSVMIKSQENKGTQVFLKLPLVSDEPTTAGSDSNF